MNGRRPTDQDGVDPNAETPVPESEPARLASVDAYVLSGSYPSISEASTPVVAEFSMDQVVPRAEPAARAFTSNDIFLRLEQTIYGPLTRERLAELLASGKLTGFEQASSNLHTWTPLIYHPRMVLSEDVDPETTHRMLQTESNLPKESVVQRRVDLAHLGEAPTESAPVESPAATPLAKMLIRPRKRSSATHNAEAAPSLDLPVFGDLGHETLESLAQRASAPGAGTMMMPAIPALAEGVVEPATLPTVAPPATSEQGRIPERAFAELERGPTMGKGNELPTLQVPATDGAGSEVLPEPDAALPAPVPAATADDEPANQRALLAAFAVLLAVAATAAAVYFYLRVTTLEREIRALRQNLPAEQR